VTSILQAKEQFLLPAVGSALYNVGIIVGLLPGLALLLIGHPDSTVAVYGATWGVVIGAVLQVAIPLPGLIKAGMRYSFNFDWRHPGIIQIARQMVPRVFNSGMLSFSTGVDRYLISSLGLLFSATVVAGLVTQYAQAFQLLLLPWSIFGATFATAAFPALAENIARNRLDRFRGTVMETLRSILFLAIPSSIGLIVLGLTIIQLLFEHGAFTYDDAARTVYPLAGFAVGLAGLSAVEILTRSFYALRDSRTPVIVSVVQFIFKIALSLLLISFAAFGPGWGIAALALSTSIATTLEAGVLLLLLQRRIGGFELRHLGRFIVQVLLVAGVMGICILISRLLLDLILPTVPAQGDTGLGIFGTLKALIKLAIEVFAGLFVYLRGARLIGLEESEPVKRVLRRFRLSWI
jgi:putative peptidoglycan lipid II flippase